MDVGTLEMRFPGLREAFSGLEADGMLVKGTKVAAKVGKVAERMKTALVERRAK